MPLDRADVEQIAILARIGLTSEEVEMFREQLSDILEQFETLKDVDTTGVAATGHSGQLQTVLRDDVPEDSLEQDQVLSNAPRREGPLFRVKAVLEE
ncbi:MAG: asparaginyl/glutamyl-tRNA amidotransferase subunit C [SAR202 cluster bacterium Io17-Chloro-G4]|nr:MAG: asparaginyl/glutamyl-tRNA amidotransferase subunit C [SAR202 cluster bacterium Io17-Chloro-G4]